MVNTSAWCKPFVRVQCIVVFGGWNVCEYFVHIIMCNIYENPRGQVDLWGNEDDVRGDVGENLPICVRVCVCVKRSPPADNVLPRGETMQAAHDTRCI